MLSFVSLSDSVWARKKKEFSIGFVHHFFFFFFCRRAILLLLLYFVVVFFVLFLLLLFFCFLMCGMSFDNFVMLKICVTD